MSDQAPSLRLRALRDRFTPPAGDIARRVEPQLPEGPRAFGTTDVMTRLSASCASPASSPPPARR